MLRWKSESTSWRQESEEVVSKVQKADGNKGVNLVRRQERYECPRLSKFNEHY